MGKLLIIGIDALDAKLLDQFLIDLPCLTWLRKDGYYAKFSSVWPPDSETAWASIYTGWNPARHGIFQFVDPLDKASTYFSSERDNRVLRGQTFWDLAGAAGRKVCVLFPHVGYPSWCVNGVMLTRAAQEKDLSVFPRDIRRSYNLDGLSGIKGLAGRDRHAYLDANRRLVERQLELNLNLIRREEWELFFTYWSALDLIQHQFWAHCDPQDPSYNGDNPFRNVIKDFYVLHDRIIQKLIYEVDPEIDIMVVSDHGHGMRPVKIFNINRLLLEHGLLYLKTSTQGRRSKAAKWLKNEATSFITRNELGGFASKILQLAPWTKQVYVSTVNLDLERTIAYITDMSGIKAYAYGGIQIVSQNIDGYSYDALCKAIITLLLDARDPNLGNVPIVKWARHREDLYVGPFIEDYPDIVFELRPDYGAGWDAEAPLFEISSTHNLYPGSHIGSNAVFMLSGPQCNRILRAPNSPMDIAPTILDLLNIPLPETSDGKSILAPKDSRKM